MGSDTGWQIVGHNVCSTSCMHSMLKLGGLGACPLRKILKIICQEIEFDDISKLDNITILMIYSGYRYIK